MAAWYAFRPNALLVPGQLTLVTHLLKLARNLEKPVKLRKEAVDSARWGVAPGPAANSGLGPIPSSFHRDPPVVIHAALSDRLELFCWT